MLRSVNSVSVEWQTSHTHTLRQTYTACRRKGLAVEHCIEGCRACRRASLICEGGKPCLNCLDTNQECIAIGEVPASMRPTVGEEASSAKQIRTKRARIACLACRRFEPYSVISVYKVVIPGSRDSKKCSNVRPCARCLSRKEECINLEPVGTIVKKRCQACRIYNRKVKCFSSAYSPVKISDSLHQQCEDRRPCIRCVEEGVECIDLARKGGPGSRIRRACTNCRFVYPPEIHSLAAVSSALYRLAKSQCDNNRPCKNCERRKLDCGKAPSDLCHSLSYANH